MDETAEKPYPLSRVIIGRVILAALIVLMTDWVAAPLLVLLSLIALASCLILQRKNRALYNARVAKVVVYGLAALIAFFYHGALQQKDRAEAEAVISVLSQYKQRHNAYPEKLSDLDPEFYRSIPRARLSPYLYYPDVWGEYRLGYVDMPPGGKCFYSSQRKNWECNLD